MKLKIITALAVLAIALSGCSSKQQPNSDSPPEQDITYAQTDVLGTNTVYIQTDGGLVPISHVVNGHSRLSGENYYYNLQALMSNEKSLKDKQYTYFASDGKNEGALSYAELEKTRHKPLTYLYSSGNWKLCPMVRHTQYSKTDVVSDGYRQFIFESFPDLFASVGDVNVTDIYEQDIDCDGTNDAVILANGEGYTVLAVQSPVMGNRILCSAYDDNEYTARVFFADIDGDGSYSLIVISGNSFKTVNVYKPQSLELDYTVYLPLEK